MTEPCVEYLNGTPDHVISDLKETVNHPSHYQSNDGIEVIDVIEAFTEGLSGITAFDIGNALKYICRWNKKGGIEDLNKAIWYLNHAIKNEERRNHE